MREVLKNIHTKYIENRIEGFYIQSLGGNPYVIRWTQGKKKPIKIVKFEQKDNSISMTFGENVIQCSIENFTVDNILPMIHNYLIGYPVGKDESVYY